MTQCLRTWLYSTFVSAFLAFPPFSLKCPFPQLCLFSLVPTSELHMGIGKWEAELGWERVRGRCPQALEGRMEVCICADVTLELLSRAFPKGVCLGHGHGCWGTAAPMDGSWSDLLPTSTLPQNLRPSICLSGEAQSLPDSGQRVTYMTS
jgi:hypothetical protein